MIPDYLDDKGVKLEKHLDELKRARQHAQEEAEHARHLHLDLEGPIEAAKADVHRLSNEILHVEKMLARIRAGFPHIERGGFEEAVDACGEVLTLEQLSEIIPAGTILGYDNQVRLPIEVQKLYAKAVSTDLFDNFLVAHCFEPPDTPTTEPADSQVAHYLFGTINSKGRDTDFFLIARW
jgi:hypothetical protein